MFMSKIQSFAIKKNFSVHTDNSVRIFTQRGLEKEKFKPAKGSQVFVGRLPGDAYEDEIYNFFSEIGSIYQIKLILKLSGETRGFAFVTFAKPELAARAVAELSGKELRYNNPLYVCLSTDYRTLIMKNAVGQNASPQRIKTIFSKVSKIVQVNEVNPSTYAIEFPEHHFAYRALKEFRDSKTEIWGPSVEIRWENQNDQKPSHNESDDQKELIKRLAEDLTRLWQREQREASRLRLNVSRAESLNSPDSGLGTCQVSPAGSLSPPRERDVVLPNHVDAARNLRLPGSGGAGALPPIQEGAAALPVGINAASTVKLHLPGNAASFLPFMDNALAPIIVDDTSYNSHLPGGGQNHARGLTNHGSNVGTSRLSLPLYAEADGLKIILPQYLPTDNQNPAFKNSRLSSAYRPAPLDQFENILSRYLPTDNQTPPFEKSKLSSAYRSAPPGFDENSIRQHGNQASALELPRAQALQVETDKYKNNAAQYVSSVNQGARPRQTQDSKLASANRPSLRGCAKHLGMQHENQATSLNARLQTEQAVADKVENVLPWYMFADNKTPPFENSRFSSAYRSSSATPANSMHVGEEMVASLLDDNSPAQSGDQIENILPQFLPTGNQPPPFEKSRLSSAYRRGSADQIENILSRFLDFLPNDSQTPPFEASRLSAVYRNGSAVAPLPYEMGRDSYKGRFMNPRQNQE